MAGRGRIEGSPREEARGAAVAAQATRVKAGMTLDTHGTYEGSAGRGTSLVGGGVMAKHTGFAGAVVAGGGGACRKVELLASRCALHTDGDGGG